MKDKLTRREAIKLGLGVAAVGAGATLAMAQKADASENKSGELSTFNKYGEDLELMLLLRTSPVAVKMLESEADIPDGAFRPKRDKGIHIAQCQAFAMSRREGKTVVMLKEDHWCPTALIAYGMVKAPAFMAKFEGSSAFKEKKYIGVATAPLKKAAFMPDVVLIYSNPAQIRGMLTPMMFGDESQVESHFFLPSCGHCVVDPMESGKFCIVLPDPGEFQRALTQDEEMIFAVPQKKMQSLMAGLKGRGKPYDHRDQYMSMEPDFEQPQFYKDMFKSWGLETK